MDEALAGRQIWLSRPADRAGAWQAALETAGATVWLAPLITTRAHTATPSRRAALDSASRADIVIATSAAAVDALAEIAPGWAPAGRLIAVGRATADALARATGRPVAVPQTQDSEGLLAMPELGDVTHRHIAVLAGEGGRTLLADDLSGRAARVDRLALYRRAPAVLEPGRRRALLWGCDSLVLTSEASWHALIGQCEADELARLVALFLVAPSLRVVQITRRDVDWQHAPTVIEPMDATGVCTALVRAAVS